jgi:HAD superfamily hydrolase (TIGR01509 family)
VMSAYQNGDLSTDAYYENMLGALERHYTLDEIASIHDAWLLDEYAGVRELVSELVQLPGVMTACLSNTNERHWGVLAPLEGAARFPSVMALGQRFASHLMRASKPDAKIFLDFQREMRADPGDILFFDDGESNVLAARGQGWRAETIDPLGDTCRQLRAHLQAHGMAVAPSYSLRGRWIFRTLASQRLKVTSDIFEARPPARGQG